MGLTVLVIEKGHRIDSRASRTLDRQSDIHERSKVNSITERDQLFRAQNLDFASGLKDTVTLISARCRCCRDSAHPGDFCT